MSIAVVNLLARNPDEYLAVLAHAEALRAVTLPCDVEGNFEDLPVVHEVTGNPESQFIRLALHFEVLEQIGVLSGDRTVFDDMHLRMMLRAPMSIGFDELSQTRH